MSLPLGIKTKDELIAMQQTGMCPSCWQSIKNFQPRATQKELDRYLQKGPDGTAASDRIASFRAIGRDPLTGHMIGCQRPALRYIEEKQDIIVMPNKPRPIEKKSTARGGKRGQLT